MPSTYSPDLRIELIANGEQSGVWGSTTNNNLGTLIEDAISGAALRTTSVQKYPLLAANGSADEARCAMLVLDTTYVGAGNYEVYAPPVTKLYVVKNASSTKDLDLYCATAVNGTTAAGAAYTIPIGKTAFVRSNGTQFFDATDYVAGSVAFTNAVLTTPSLAGETFSTAATVSAAGTTQGNGTALTADYNVVTTVAASSGVVLPTATVGRRIIIVNRGANTLNVYPFATGSQQIDALGANNPITIPVNGVMMFNAATTSRWYSSSTLTLTDPLITTPSLVAAKVSTSASVTAGTNVQGQGALTSDYNVITSAAANPSGVTLPAATVGRKVLIVNKGANPVNVYPATSAAIDAIAANSPISLPVGGLLEFNASSATQWYSSYNATTAGSAGSVSFTGTAPIANQVVTYASTTGTSITTGYIYEFKATSTGQAQLRLYEDADSAGTNYVAIQPPASLANTYTLTLPTTDGNANEFLQTDGNGVLSWAAAAAGGVTSVTGSGAITASPTTGAVTVSVANAGSSTAGIVTTGSQQFGGAKRFALGMTVNAADQSSGAWPFYAASTTTAPAISGWNSSTGYAGNFMYVNGSSNPIIFQTAPTGPGGTLTTTGSISGTASTVAYNTSSDYRLKENVVPLTDAITRLKLLAPKRFTWKAAPEEGVIEGFIAHEVQEIVPVAVHGVKDAVDTDGKIVPQGMDASFLVPLLTAALQEAVARIEALEARLANM